MFKPDKAEFSAIALWLQLVLRETGLGKQGWLPERVVSEQFQLKKKKVEGDYMRPLFNEMQKLVYLFTAEVCQRGTNNYQTQCTLNRIAV